MALRETPFSTVDASATDADEATPVRLRLAPGALRAIDLDADATLGQVVRAGLADGARRIVESDAVVRRDDQTDGVHQARVGCRRVRSTLRTFHEVVDADWAAALSDDLAWYGRLLSPVRDADVLAQRLRRQLDELSDLDRDAADELLACLADERNRSLTEAYEAMSSERYESLVTRVVEVAGAPRLRKKAGRPAADALPRLVAKPYAKVAAAVEALPDEPTDPQLHALRKKVKRARYAADAAVPVVGKPARKLHEALRALQETLGDHQDAVVAEQWLRRQAPAVSGPAGLVAGQLLAVERSEAAETRAAWPRRWADCRRRKRVAWLG